MKKYLAAFFLVFLVLIASCTSSKTNINSNNKPPPVPTGETKIFNIDSKSSHEFSSNIINVNEGDTVILKIKNTDIIAHGFGLAGYNINKELPPGETVEVQFVADQKGTFDFICTVPCGPGHSTMNGKVIVS